MATKSAGVGSVEIEADEMELKLEHDLSSSSRLWTTEMSDGEVFGNNSPRIWLRS